MLKALFYILKVFAAFLLLCVATNQKMYNVHYKKNTIFTKNNFRFNIFVLNLQLSIRQFVATKLKK